MFNKKEYWNKWYLANKERRSKQQAQYRQTTKYKDTKRQYNRWHRLNNKEYYDEFYKTHPQNEYFKEYRRNKYHNDILFRLACILRSRLGMSKRGKVKTGSAVQDLGCSIENFKTYIASKFQPKMSWENYGKWHLDHIIPLSSFNLENRDEFLKACHYTNLQPLWAIDNFKKSDNI